MRDVQSLPEVAYGPITTTIAFLKRVKPAIADLREDQVQVLASAIAFNALLSFFPFLILLLSLCRGVFHWNAGYDAVLSILRDYVPVAKDFVENNLKALTTEAHTEGEIQIISLISLWITSAGTLVPIEIALNRAWGVEQSRSIFKRYPLVLVLVLISGTLMFGAVFVSAEAHSMATSLVGELANGSVVKFILWMIEKLITIPVTILIFLLLYYFLPNTKVRFLQVLPAAIFVGLIWEGSKYLFAALSPKLNFHSTYGPFYVTVTLVFWAFLSALLMLLGANLSAQNLFPTFRRRGDR
jgi:YihY family inner membrane protein